MAGKATSSKTTPARAKKPAAPQPVQKVVIGLPRNYRAVPGGYHILERGERR